MALTKAQWYSQIVNNMPSWATENPTMVAIFWGMAASFEALQESAEENVAETFILTASSESLNTHGDERSIDRIDGDRDETYRARVRNLFNQSNPVALVNAINDVLVRGTARIKEDFQNEVFLDREEFINRGLVILDETITNAFTVIVDKQIYEPLAYCDREYFMDVDAYACTDESLDRILNSIIAIVNKNKALGTVFRLIELAE